MVATDEWYEKPIERPLCTYLPCGFCDGEGCCVCDHFGHMHKDHPLFGAIPINEPVQPEQEQK